MHCITSHSTWEILIEATFCDLKRRGKSTQPVNVECVTVHRTLHFPTHSLSQPSPSLYFTADTRLGTEQTQKSRLSSSVVELAI